MTRLNGFDLWLTTDRTAELEGIEPKPIDFYDARDLLADEFDELIDLVDQDDLRRFYKTDEAFREKAQRIREGWICDKAQELAEKRAQREAEEEAQNQADARGFDSDPGY